ncbi:hypothetical protein [Pontibacillus litoralis]|uniref:Uncharacterized protein n=1 Tax=Pontibacillus litoralis JSM 072002 TaxID=1385512 RepID=A0A0A5G7U4_9BACI|nr:hypothetical protein [Pontibacillus litoralis]KGX89211.1 hypothetical protein N784_01970 [Pontibacillus litoralis JSM 072002]
MEPKKQTGLQYEPEGEQIIAQQLSESYQSGVIDQVAHQPKDRSKHS